MSLQAFWSLKSWKLSIHNHAVEKRRMEIEHLMILFGRNRRQKRNLKLDVSVVSEADEFIFWHDMLLWLDQWQIHQPKVRKKRLKAPHSKHGTQGHLKHVPPTCPQALWRVKQRSPPNFKIHLRSGWFKSCINSSKHVPLSRFGDSSWAWTLLDDGCAFVSFCVFLLGPPRSVLSNEDN